MLQNTAVFPSHTTKVPPTPCAYCRGRPRSPLGSFPCFPLRSTRWRLAHSMFVGSQWLRIAKQSFRFASACSKKHFAILMLFLHRFACCLVPPATLKAVLPFRSLLTIDMKRYIFISLAFTSRFFSHPL